MDFEKRASGVKQKVYEILRKRQEEKDGVSEKTEQNVEKDIEVIVNKILTKKNNVNSYSDSTDDQSDSEDIRLRTRAKYNRTQYNKTPFCYIDYNIDNINIAKKNDYKTILIDKGNLENIVLEDIKNEKYFKFDNTHAIFNLWNTLTKSSLSSLSFDCTDYEYKKFSSKFEKTIKWGSKQYIKETLNKEQQKNYSLFMDGAPELIRFLFHKGVKIFIVVNCDYSFVKRIFMHYKLDKYVKEYFTPSRCGMPHGKLTTHTDSYKDNKKINKERVFACIERYVGRLPKY